MGQVETTQFGPIEYDDAAVVFFPLGLPAFEGETRFLLIEREESTPVVFLQSLNRTNLLFMTLPSRLIDSEYRLDLSGDDRAALGLPLEGELTEGEDLISLAILTAKPGLPITANLLAPVVIGARSRRAYQIIQSHLAYPVDHPVGTATAEKAEASCS